MVKTTKDNMSDEELFMLVKQGDEQAFNILYARYSRKILAYCITALKDKDDAKDVFQTIIFHVLENKHKFTGGNYLAWVMTIVRNNCLLHKRDKKFTDNIDDINQEKHSHNSQADFLLQEQLIKAMDELPEEYKEPIKLRYINDFSYEEIANITNCSLALVKVRVHRGKTILQKVLEPLRESR